MNDGYNALDAPGRRRAMGQLVSSAWRRVSAWWHRETVPELLLEDSLAKVRNARAVMERKAAHHRRSVGDEDVIIVDLGLRMQQADNRLAELDAQEFRRRFHKKKLLTRSHGTFQVQIRNLDVQIERLENAPALEMTLESLQSGVDESTRASERINSIMRSVRTLLAASPELFERDREAVDEELSAMDDARLESELTTLMESEEFKEKFSEDYREQRRLALLACAPEVPTKKPTVAAAAATTTAKPERNAAQVERELGLAQ